MNTISRNLHLVVLAAVTVLAVALRVYQVGESLWVDELHTAWVVAGDISQIVPRARIGNQSPLYFYLAWASSGLFGMNEVALRLPSLAAGTALVPLVYLLVYGWTTSRGAALLAALLTAIDRDLIYIAQEARPYALVQLVALVQISVFWKLTAASTESARGRAASADTRQAYLRMVFVLLTTTLIWLHYTAALLLIGEVSYFGYLALLRKGSARYGWFDFGFDLLIAAAFCAPLVYPLREVFNRRHLWRQFVSIFPTWSMVRAAGLYVALPLFSLGAVAVVRLLSESKTILARVDGRAIALVIGWLGIPLAVAWLSTFADLARLFFQRYLMASALALPAMVGLSLAALPTRVTQGCFALLMVVVSIATSGMVEQFRYDGRLLADRNEDWRAAAKYIADTQDTPLPPVHLEANLIENALLPNNQSDELVYYLRFPLTGIYALDADGRRIIPPLSGTDEDSAAEDAADGFWLVVRGSEAAAERNGRQYLDIVRQTDVEMKKQYPDFLGRGVEIEPWQHFGDGLHVARVKVSQRRRAK